MRTVCSLLSSSQPRQRNLGTRGIASLFPAQEQVKDQGPISRANVAVRELIMAGMVEPVTRARALRRAA